MPDNQARDLETKWLTMSADGHLIIPASMRRDMGLETGGHLVGKVEDGRLVLEPYQAVVQRVQDYFSRYADPTRSIVDELIADRRAEAARENEE